MREFNRSAVLRLISERGSLSRSAIAGELNLSRSTVTRIVKSLIEERYVSEGEAFGFNVGRKHISLRLNSKRISFIGIDLVGQCIQGALADLSGNILQRLSSAPIIDKNGPANLAMLYEVLDALLLRSQQEGIEVAAIGIGAPATCLNFPPLAPIWQERLNWGHILLDKEIEQKYRIKTVIENDGDLAAMSERWLGAGKGVDDLVVISVGTGISGGVIVGGSLHHGFHHTAGSPGSLVPGKEFIGRDYARTFGCLESLISVPAMLEKAGLAASREQDNTSNSLYPSAQKKKPLSELLEAARKGEERAAAARRQLVEYLSIATIAIACLLDPQMIVIGGQFGPKENHLLLRIEENVKKAVRAAPEIRLSSLGDEAVLLGAIALAQQGEFSG